MIFTSVGLYTFVLINFTIINLRIIISIQSSEHRGEYCDTEIFKAECLEGWIILLTSAWYGRMKLGRCVGMYLGHMGCKKDVLTTADKRCSGKRVCEIRIPDAEFESYRPCIKELKTYLEASYICIKAETTSSDECKSSNELKVSSTSGFLASIVTSDTPSCDGLTHPWVIRGLKGQRVNLTLYDFALDKNVNPKGTSSASIVPYSPSSSSSPPCTRYGMLEDGGSLRYEICGSQERTSHLYLSYTHLVKVWMTAGSAPTDLKRFAIQFSVVGCADPNENLQHFWFRRKFLSQAQNSSSSPSPSSSSSSSSSPSLLSSSSPTSSSSSSSPLVAPQSSLSLPSYLTSLPYSYNTRVRVTEVGVWGCRHSSEVVESECDLASGSWSKLPANCSTTPITTEMQIGQEVDLLLRHSNKRSRDKNTTTRSILNNKMFLLMVVGGVMFIFISTPLIYIFYRLKKRKRNLKQKQRHSVLVQENLDATPRENHNLADNFSRQNSGTFHQANKAEIKPLINQCSASDEANYRQVSVQRSQDRFQVRDSSSEHKLFFPPPPSISSGEQFHHDLQHHHRHLPCYHHQHNHPHHHQQQLLQLQRPSSSSLVEHNPYHSLRQGERKHHKNVTWCLHDDLAISPSDLSAPQPEPPYLSITLPRTTHSTYSNFKSSRTCDIIIPEDFEVQTADVLHPTTEVPHPSTALAVFSKNSDIESLTSLLDGGQSNVLKLNHVTQSPSISDVSPQSKLPFTKKTLLTDV